MNSIVLENDKRIKLRGDLVIQADARRAIDVLPAASIQCVVTSPPYWGLRNYGNSLQIGIEPVLAEYINNVTGVISKLRRVLKDDGILWLNLGDSYTSGDRMYRSSDKKNGARQMLWRPCTPPGLKKKELIGIPWRVALAIQEAGWYLRTDIVWSKTNPTPESVKDRPSRAHEYVFMFTKSDSYHYNYSESLEPGLHGLRNSRSVWNIPTKPFKLGHAATFPGELVQKCIQVSAKKGSYVLDPFFGAGTVGLVAKSLGLPFVGIELNPDYVKIALDRLASASK